ncbi:phage terminase small subunit [Xanthomonas citri]|uniref:phage terminase small subunit n=1 Tax=Xanthomonas citri TaxID=346 RepID=UPI0009C377B7|nr:phage terminase small subunit [Xanthomonas citri]AMV03969.1 terminase endonuclease subunit [Xanthomonas citri pv. aurantifolii]TBX00964.1 terminase endonuclease subunit [Xanthomonas citri pv. aurantifolii]
MADSPAKRHHSRVLAALEAEKRSPGQLMTGATIHEQQLAELHGDRLRLKQVQSEEGKAELKRQLLPKYDPYLDGVLQADGGAQDEIVTNAMVWHIDAGSYARGLQLADYVLRHKLKLPDRFARTTGCLVAEEIAEAAFKIQRGGDLFDLAIVAQAIALTDAQDMPDEVRAKLLLVQGRGLMAGIGDAPPLEDQPAVAAAVTSLRRAIELHSSCGGKKDLERAERVLKKFGAEPVGTTPAPDGA